MKIIGVTGPSGSGKSLLTYNFAKSGIPTIDADTVYHNMLIPPSECLDALRVVFGDNIFNTDGSLNRTELAKIVFNDQSKLDLLNKTVLGLVLKEIRKQIQLLAQAGAKAVIIDGPTLIESGFHKECDIVVTVISPKEERIRRISHRDCIDEARALERISAQKPDSFYTDVSDFVIINDTDEKTFTEKISELVIALELDMPEL